MSIESRVQTGAGYQGSVVVLQKIGDTELHVPQRGFQRGGHRRRRIRPIHNQTDVNSERNFRIGIPDQDQDS